MKVEAVRTGNELTRAVEAGRMDTRKWFDYAAAVVATLAATLLRLALTPLVGSGAPFITHFAAAVTLAWYRGFWPAAVSTFLSVIAGVFFVLPAAGPEYSFFGRSARATVVGFALLSLIVSFLIDFQRRTLIRARLAEKAQAAIAKENAGLLGQAKQSEKELQSANEELRRANRDLETFAYSASHDLREPLRTIAISAELVERNSTPQLSPDGVNFLRQIKAAARRMDVLLDDILTYSRAMAKEPGPPPLVDASQVLTGVLANLRGQLEGSGTIVTTGRLPRLEIHASSLALVFQNLISNAVKYRGKEAPRVHIEADERNGKYTFSIVDNGLGVDPQFSEQIFELFNRLHAQGEYPGSGLGLAICRRVVEHYGGSIWLQESEPGRGSTFCFSIPQHHDQ